MNTKKLSIISVVLLMIQIVTANMVFAVTNYVSINEEWNGGTGWAAVQMWIMQAVDLLDDDRRSQFSSFSTFETYTFSWDIAGWIEANYGTEFFDMVYDNGSIVTVERVDVDAFTATGTVNATNSNPKIEFSSSLQDNSPKPFTFANAWVWNETAGWSSSNRNALLFTFSGTPVDWFWFWLWDTESRSDGEWVEAEIEYFNSAWVLIGTWVIWAAAWVDQSLCGGSSASNSPSACGNETTRYVWFKKSSPTEDVKYMRVIVGDDDDPADAGTTDWNTEHLSFLWPTIVEEIFIPDLWLTKTWSTVAMSGDEIGYSLVVTNFGPGAASWVVVEEIYPSWFNFLSSSPAPSLGNNVWNVWVLGSGSVYSIAITWSIDWMTGDYVNTAWVSAETETGSMVNTWSHTTSLICDANFGNECQWEANVCGWTIPWTIACDGSCDAVTAQDPIGLWIPCNAWLWVCAATGITVCDPTWFGVMCNTVAWIPSEIDTCDGLDNDCDGEIDEDFAPVETSCGIWECGATWVTSCVEGVIVDSCEALAPSENDAVCDGLDNDCDGQIDEDYFVQATSCGIGACQAAWTLSCIDWSEVDSCVEGAAWIDAVCNGIDDDCDGLIDEDFVVEETSCGVGECGSSWATSCIDWVVINTCESWTPADTDMCDGLDNDCDGIVDEDFVVQDTSCGIGECWASWATSCVEGSVVDSCLEWSPSAELCDELDNNCDGEVDEGDVCEEPVDPVAPVPVLPEPETTDVTISIVCTPEIAQSWEMMTCDVVYENLWEWDAQDTNVIIDFPENVTVTNFPEIPGVECAFSPIDCGGEGYALWAWASINFSFDAVVTWDRDDVFIIDATISTTTEEIDDTNNNDSDVIQLFEISNSWWWGWNANYCGDGNRSNWEACDDGNNISWDGCSNNCSLEEEINTNSAPIINPFVEEPVDLWVQTNEEELIQELTQEDLVVVEAIVDLQQEVIELNELHSASPTMLPTLEGFALPAVLPKTWASL